MRNEEPQYKKTVETDSLGVTLTTEYGFDENRMFHHAYTYEHGNRRVEIQAVGNGEPLPKDWHTRQSAYAQYYENGKPVGKLRSYNHLDNAQLKAVRYVLGLTSDSAADRAIMDARREKYARNMRTLTSLIPKNAIDFVRKAAEDNGFNLDRSSNSRVERFVQAYADKANTLGMFQLIERHDALIEPLVAWAKEHEDADESEYPDSYREMQDTYSQIIEQSKECAKAAASTL